MATNKTVPAGAQIGQFIEAVPDERERRDCREWIEWMRAKYECEQAGGELAALQRRFDFRHRG